MAPTGQTPAQEPHSMQEPASISKWSLPIAIAPTGQVASQAPQLRQSLLITYAMEHTSSHDTPILPTFFQNCNPKFVPLWVYFYCHEKKLRKKLSRRSNYEQKLAFSSRCGQHHSSFGGCRAVGIPPGTNPGTNQFQTGKRRRRA